MAEGWGQETETPSPLLLLDLRCHEDFPTFLHSVDAPELLPLLFFLYRACVTVMCPVSGKLCCVESDDGLFPTESLCSEL